MFQIVSELAWKWIFLGLIATPFALLLALWSSGAGHGDYVLAAILFPYTLWSTAAFESITSVFVVAAIVQFPLYGSILAFAGGHRKTVAMALALTHIAAVVLCFIFASDSFLS
jgi:hypothetical protein